MNTIRLFLASSNEIADVRDVLTVEIASKNKVLKPRNIQIEVDRWEFESSTVPVTGRSQDKYNELVRKADLIAIVIKNKVGKYTKEEFSVAYDLKRRNGKPDLCIYKLPSDKHDSSLDDFLEDLHAGSFDYYPSDVENADMLWNRLNAELDRLVNDRDTRGRKDFFACKIPTKNYYFVGRQRNLDWLYEGFHTHPVSSSIQVIFGKGGIGKSQLAREYANIHSDEYGDAVWWIHAESAVQDCKSLIEKFGFPNNNNNEAEIQSAFVDWCQNHDSWLLIFDNVKNAANIAPFLSGGHKGHILITTRDRFELSHSNRQKELFGFSEEDIHALVKRKNEGRTAFSFEEERDAIDTLSERLGFFPLAVSQAVSYVFQNNCHYQDYLDLLKTHARELFEEKAPDYEYVLATTWDINVNCLSDAQKQLLYLCSYIAPYGITKDIFKKGKGNLPKPIQDELADDHKCDRVFRGPYEYSLLDDDTTIGSYTIHRLVQEVTRQKVKAGGEDGTYITAGFNMIDSLFPKEFYLPEHFSDYTLLFAHADRIFAVMQEYCSEANDGLEALVTQSRLKYGYERLGRGCLRNGDYTKARYFFLKVFEIDRATGAYDDIRDEVDEIVDEAIGSDDTSSGSYRFDLKDFFYNMTKEKTREKAGNMLDLGDTFAKQGQRDIADEFYRLTQVLFDEEYGEGHRLSTIAYEKLAASRQAEGEYDEALELLMKSMEIREKEFGVDDLATAVTYYALGSLYLDMGLSCELREKEDARNHYEEALRYFKRTLAIRELKFTGEHPDMSKIYNGIAEVYKQLGDIDSALVYQQKHLNSCIAVQGSDHLDTSVAYNNYGELLRIQKRYEDAIGYYNKAIDIIIEKLGGDNPIRATLLNNISMCLAEMEFFFEAMEVDEMALDIRKKSYGDTHRETVLSYANIACLYEKMGIDACDSHDTPQGRDYFVEAYKIALEHLGENHSFTKVFLNDIHEAYILSFGDEDKFETWLAERLNGVGNVKSDQNWLVLSEDETTVNRSNFPGFARITDAIIPEGVTAIGDFAFSLFEGLVNISIPDTVTRIGNSAFSACTSLESVHLPAKLASIGENAFCADVSLRDINIPSSVTFIGKHAFGGCTNLKELVIPSSVDYDSWRRRIELPAGTETVDQSVMGVVEGIGEATDIIIPETVTTIGERTFSRCADLTIISLPSTLLTIEDWGFSACHHLASVVIPDSVTYIGEYAFSNCSTLTDVRLPNSLTRIARSTFNGLNCLTRISIPDSVLKIDALAFGDCPYLTDITIPDSVEEIHENAFWGCKLPRIVRVRGELTPVIRKAFRRNRVRYLPAEKSS